ncbi:hypothetical protein MASR1M65_04560 [Saprospiraceae bacterium]
MAATSSRAPFYTFYKGVMTAEFMNRLGYDAMTVGNHEFDDGPEVLAGFVDAVKFPVLMSNADISMEPKLTGQDPEIHRDRAGGEKIGLIGLTPVDTPEIASPGKNVIFTDPVQAVQGEVDRLTAEGVNKIVVLSHSGYLVDQRVATGTTGVDVIVGGHDNTYLSNVSDKAVGPYPTMVGKTAIVQAYAYGKFLGELNVTFDDAGEIVEAKGEPLIMDKAVAEDSDTLARIAELAAAAGRDPQQGGGRKRRRDRRQPRQLPPDRMHHGQSGGRCDAGAGERPGCDDRAGELGRAAGLHRRGPGDDGRGADRAAVPEHAFHLRGVGRDAGRGAGERRQPV